ncbi:unnamed protein product, partial [Onchocerca ochengi]
IELGEDEEVQIQFDDIESVQHLFETGQLTMADNEQAIILEENLSDPKYCYNVNYGDNSSTTLVTGGARFVESEKEIVDGRNKQARKQEFEENSQHHDFNTTTEPIKSDAKRNARSEEMSKEDVILLTVRDGEQTCREDFEKH